MLKKTLSIVISLIIFTTVFIVDVPTYSAPVMAGLSMGEFLFGSTYASLMSGMLDTFDSAEDPSFDEVLGALVESEYDVDGTKLKACVSVSDLVKIGFTYEKAKKAEELYNKYTEMNVYYLGLADKLERDAELEEIAEKREELIRQMEQAKRDAEYSAYRTIQSNYNDAVDVIKSGIQVIGGIKTNADYANKSLIYINGMSFGALLSDNIYDSFYHLTGKNWGYAGAYRQTVFQKRLSFTVSDINNNMASFLSAISNVDSDASNHLKLLHLSYKYDSNFTTSYEMTSFFADKSNYVIKSFVSNKLKSTSIPYGYNVFTPIFLYSTSNISVDYSTDYATNNIGYLSITSDNPIYYLLPSYTIANHSEMSYVSSSHVGVSNDGELCLGLSSYITSDNVNEYVSTFDAGISLDVPKAKIAILPFVLPQDVVNTAVGIDDFIRDKEKIYAPVLNGDIPIDGDIVDVPIDGTIPDDDKDGISFPSILDVNLTKVGGIELDKATKFNFSSVTALGKEFTNKFPFCLPWDLFYLVNKFNQPPSDPIFEIDMSYFTLKEFKSDVEGIKFKIDLTDYDYIIKMLRFFILAIFVFGLISNTGKLIKH